MSMIQVLIAVSLLHWAILVTPGANVIVVTQLAASGQRRAACFAALGITTVAGIWSALAVMGVSAVFAAHPQWRLVIQVAGGVYLLYVAVRLWLAGGSASDRPVADLTAMASFRLGFFTNILNPKSALFFGSAFATALPKDPSTGLLIACLGVVLCNALAWHMALAFALAAGPVRAAYARQRKVLNRCAGVLVGAFGLRLLLAVHRDLRAGP